ncbi:protein Barley B recombinant-like [Asparagus officinalis]|uniref:protein Barley B recombinant-like n=1 Tax=Asparagus officinalis TaxID=4686 RepID=UPI00098DF206|nr:protein Barley B recombinant-like [Asparagus officinalis]XP_020256821.1 protein Barley B recombinant-like [Asparagus officinalis]
MDDDGGLNMRSWGSYFEQPMKGSLGLQLMSNLTADRDTKPLLSNGGFLHRDRGIPEHSAPMDFVRDGWIHHNRDTNKILHVLPMNHHQGFSMIPDTSGAHTIHMLQTPHPPKEEKIAHIDNSIDNNDATQKKRSQGRTIKAPKQKKPKKVNNQGRDDLSNGAISKGNNGKKSTDLVINGIDLDLSGIPPPVCSCTGNPQQCYRWGVGGWQSACCTTSISTYPLPMSSKRRGARIAGRKMSLGAFKKVLEKLAGEGHNLSNPIDLKTFWAKHGTNKFVTIR